MEFVNGGNLYENMRKVGRFPEDTVKFYIAQIVLALEVLHKMRIMHRDLKPENVLICEDGYIKLADFGLSTF